MKAQKTVLTSRIDLLDISKDELFLIKRGLAMFADREMRWNTGHGAFPETLAADKLIKELEMLEEV